MLKSEVVLQPALVQIGSLIGANFNTTADQPIILTLPTANWLINAVFVVNASVSLTTAAGGIYTGAGKTGVALVPSSQTYTALTGAAINTVGSAGVLGPISTAYFNVTTLYFSLTTPQGSAATADIRIVVRPIY